MIVTLQTQRVQTLEQVRRVEASARGFDARYIVTSLTGQGLTGQGLSRTF